VDNNTATHEILPQDIAVFPNPSQETLNIDLNDKNASVYYIRVLNTQGRVMMMLPQPNLNKSINISELPKGFYLLEITDKTNFKTTTVKFCKE
jgi:hypothetical protein